MKPTTFITALLSTGLICGGCESDVNFTGKEAAAKMVLNSMIDCSDSSHFIKVSESVFVFSDQEPKSIDNPNLELTLNGLPVAVTYDHSVKENAYYKFDALLHPGDKIEIAGYSQAHGHVAGTDLVPNPPQILAVTPEWFTGTEDGISYLRTKIRIKDRPNEDNYYRIVIHTKTVFAEDNPDEIIWTTSKVYLDQEILFKDIAGTLGNTDTNLFAIFSDEIFQGQEYSLNVYIQEDNFSAWGARQQHVNVEIHSLSGNLYRYLRSLELAANDDHFSEPVKIFSNINGGYGILGTYTIDQMTIEIK